MKSTSLKADLDECFLEYQFYARSRNFYSALGCMGEILDGVQEAPAAVRNEWHERLKDVQIGEEAVVDKVRLEMGESGEYVLRLLSISGILIYENVVLILTKRVEIENILRALRFLNVDLDFSLDSIDSAIEAGFVSHRDEFMQARRSIIKHSRLPSTNRWLIESP